MGKLLLLLLAIAVVIYVVTRLIETRGHPFRRSAPRPGPGRPGPPRPLGPDDDPDFLRDLNRRRRQKKKDGEE
ncbi:hypothetical protein [Nocardioides donggukensis]|uniref:Uncharacterized protein n=1 Tax=Nocardioides donggukensis TaxID=2774019 RepID=A0A927K8A2_9ACTN|nr:hypothetical protein [Nocardioides donggukensis]MBD8870818.1 hypothetical protein [Nocardioides donggukensis]